MLRSLTFAAALATATAAFADGHGKKTNVDIAAADDRFETLVAAVTAAGLGETLMGDDGSGQMANVIIADIEASNGVIHVIDKVVLPGNAPNC